MITKIIKVYGGTLFFFAAQELGDATQWYRIAQLSNLGPDPILPRGVPTVLYIPQRDRTKRGGVYRGGRAPSVYVPPNDSLLGYNDGVPLLGFSDNVPLVGD